MENKKKLTPQQRANQRQNEKRASMPKYTILMTKEESELLNKLANLFGSKKNAIIQGLKVLEGEEKKE